jgi:hypothetical protein
MTAAKGRGFGLLLKGVYKNAAKRLNYDHASGKTIVRGKVKNGEVVDLIAIKLCR